VYQHVVLDTVVDSSYTINYRFAPYSVASLVSESHLLGSGWIRKEILNYHFPPYVLGLTETQLHFTESQPLCPKNHLKKAKKREQNKLAKNKTENSFKILSIIKSRENYFFVPIRIAKR
jgi:hypothetical protein